MNKVDYEENGWHSPPTVLFVPIFNNRSKNSLTIGDGMNCTFEHICSNSKKNKKTLVLIQ